MVSTTWTPLRDVVNFGFGLIAGLGRSPIRTPVQANTVRTSPSEERILDDSGREIDDVVLFLRPAIRVFGCMGPNFRAGEVEGPILRLVGDDVRTGQDIKLPANGTLESIRALEDIQSTSHLTEVSRSSPGSAGTSSSQDAALPASPLNSPTRRNMRCESPRFRCRHDSPFELLVTPVQPLDYPSNVPLSQFVLSSLDVIEGG